MKIPTLRPCPQCAATCEATHQYCPKCGFPVGSISISNQDPFIGRTLPGGYQILDVLSVGGMGRVYRAEQSVLGRTVAVKVIHPHLLSEETSIARFLTEARAASQLNHPNSVSVIDFGKTEDKQPYLVMEFLRGKDLSRVAYEQGPLTIRRICSVLTQVMLALEEAHALGIIHRDLKPENIILEPTRRGGDFVKVVDFGLAKLREDPTANVTLPGIVCGTPDYMAPEQGRGDPIDGRSDLYAVGVVLFQLLTGRLPYEADTPTKVVLKHINDPIPDPREIAPKRKIGERLARVVQKALAKKPGERYQEAHAFILALEAASEEGPLSVASKPPAALGECRACLSSVPMTRFCQECGARLPSKSDHLDAEDLTGELRFVGRDDDVTWLDAKLAETSDIGRAVKLIGETGVGKSRLLDEFLRGAATSVVRVVRVGPDPWWASVACHGLRSAIAELTGHGTLDSLMPTLFNVDHSLRLAFHEIYTGVADARDNRNVDERRHGFAAALQYAVDTASRGTTIIAIDDLDRLDNTSVHAFGELARRETPGLMLVVTHRSGFDPGWQGVETRLINGLPPATVARLMPPHPLIEQAIGALDVGARGLMPLHLRHLVGFVADGGNDPPHRTADLIAQRLNNLGPAERDVVQALAVLGDDVGEKHLAKILELEVDLEALLRELESKGFISRTPGAVSLAHPMLHGLISIATPAQVRRELHKIAAEYFEGLDVPIEVRAAHACAAGDALEALILLEQVAERAVARGDEQGGVDALRKALELAREQLYLGELDDPMKAVVIFGRKLGEALINAGDLSDAHGVLREALDMTGPAGPERAQLLLSLARLAHTRARSDEALALLDEATHAAEGAGSAALMEQLEAVRVDWAM